MEEDGIQLKLLRRIHAYFSLTRMQVKAAGQETTSFEVQSVVRLGDNMSPILFIYAIDCIPDHALRRSLVVQVDLTYADDTALLSDSAKTV